MHKCLHVRFCIVVYTIRKNEKNTTNKATYLCSQDVVEDAYFQQEQ